LASGLLPWKLAFTNSEGYGTLGVGGDAWDRLPPNKIRRMSVSNHFSEDPRGPYIARLIGSTGCEICNPAGQVIAWSVNEYWAVVIVQLLNEGPTSPEGEVGPLDDSF
jgi:hypothetical protein